MKRLISLFALMLIMAMLLLPLGAAFAEDSGASDDADGVMTILSNEEDSQKENDNAADGASSGEVTTTGAEEPKASEAAVNENSALVFSIFDGEGKETRNFSMGLSCGAGGITLFSRKDYRLDFAFVDSKTTSFIANADNLKIVDCSQAMIDKYLSIDGNKLTIKAGSDNYSFKVVDTHNGKEYACQYSFNVAKFKVDFSDILILGIAVYALATAITGSGAMFRNEFIKEGKEEDFKKYVRICALLVGVCMLGVAAISIFGCGIDGLTWVKYVLFGIGIAALICSIVITNKMTDKEKKAKAMTGGRQGASNSSAAFEFDEDEPTIDDVLANMKNKKDN